jgi:hypothetical protein
LKSGAYLGQVKDLIAEAEKTIAKGDRVMITTLTKKMAEDLSAYLKEAGIKSEYLHSDVKTMDRIKVLTAFRQGAENGGFDCLVGVNLLREGLDLPEVSLIGILDADKEGFLRSETSLIQTIGRAARNVVGESQPSEIINVQMGPSGGGDNTPPGVVGEIVVSNISNNEATVSWATDELATSSIFYDVHRENQHGLVTVVTTTLDHQINLTGLVSCTTYFFVVGEVRWLK